MDADDAVTARSARTPAGSGRSRAAGPAVRRCACVLARRAAARARAGPHPGALPGLHLRELRDPQRLPQATRSRSPSKFVENYPDQDVGLLFIGPLRGGQDPPGRGHPRRARPEEGRVGPLLRFPRPDPRHPEDLHARFGAVRIRHPRPRCSKATSSSSTSWERSGPTAWVEETIFYIVNHRYNRQQADHLHLELSSTRGDEEDRAPADVQEDRISVQKGDDSLVDRIGFRLRSRIYEMCKVVDDRRGGLPQDRQAGRLPVLNCRSAQVFGAGGFDLLAHLVGDVPAERRRRTS